MVPKVMSLQKQLTLSSYQNGDLENILGEYDYQALDLKSCMTLDVENCHATVYSKKVNLSKLEYARSFGATMKESVKHATS